MSETISMTISKRKMMTRNLKLYFACVPDIDVPPLANMVESHHALLLRGHGLKDNEYCVRRLLEDDSLDCHAILSNDEQLLNNKSFFNETDNRYDIHILHEGSFKRIDELTCRELRYANNILKMYLAGAFD